MGIREAIADFKKAASKPERFDVYILGELVGSAVEWSTVDTDDGDVYFLYYKFYPRSPSGIFPIGDIVVDFEEGLVYMFQENKEGDVEIDYERPVSIIEAIAKEL